MKDDLCKAFCGAITVRDVPIGLAVGTAFRGDDGDAIGFYVVRSQTDPSVSRLEDDGTVLPTLEASGIDLSEGPPAESFAALLSEYGVEHDLAENVLHTPYLKADSLAAAALRFVAFLLRVQDFNLVTRERVEETFKTDVVRAIRERFGERAKILEDAPVSESYAEFPADIVILPRDSDPMAVFIGTSENKALEAILFWMQTTYRSVQHYKSMLVLETAKPVRIKERTLARALNSFPVAVFSGAKTEVMDAMEREIYGRIAAVH